MIKKYIKRALYLEKIRPFIDKDIIKVIVGQRRVGKSYLLFQIMDEIKAKHKTANIIYINKELSEFDAIKTHRDLLDHIKKYDSIRKSYVFIDEIQDIDSFEKALRSLQSEGKYDIYCTGSNANLLSSELATYLSGRYIEMKVFSLSYSEFLSFHKLSENKESFLRYIKYGGLPYLINLELTDDVAYGYVKSVYSTILLKDVVSRYKIRNVSFLENLIGYIADNIGSLVSAKKISDFLKAQKINISTNIVLDYLSFLANAFFVLKVSRSDVRGKKIFEVNTKYYFEDLGLRNSIVRYNQTDINKILENLVFMQLQILGYTVTVGQLKGKEIDFVCEKQGRKMYIQTAYIITEENKEREFGNLLEIQDNYPKFVISMDEMIAQEGYKGVQHINIRDFLSNTAAWN